MKTTKTSAGYILPIVLFLIVILTAGGLFALHIAKQDIAHTTLLIDTAEAKIESESQLEIIKYYVASGRFTLNRIENSSLENAPSPYPKHLYIDGREHNLTATTSFRLQDSAGMLNAMYPNGEAIALLLKQKGTIANPETISESISDWLDPDDTQRLNGAEENYYRNSKYSYSPRNALLLTATSELRLVRGIRELDKEQWSYLKSHLITSPVSAFNFTTAPMELIGSQLHVSPKELDGLRELREENLDLFLSRLRTIGTGYNPETGGIFPSHVLYITLRSKKNGAIQTLHSIIDFNEYDDAPFHTLSAR